MSVLLAGCSGSNDPERAPEPASTASPSPAASTPQAPSLAPQQIVLPPRDLTCFCGRTSELCPADDKDPCRRPVCAPDPRILDCHHCQYVNVCNDCVGRADGEFCSEKDGTVGRCFKETCCTGCFNESGACVPLANQDTKVCGAGGSKCSGCNDDNVCTVNACVSGQCRFDTAAPATTVCRASGGVCDVAETCEGTRCPSDGKVTAGTTCGTDDNPCTVDQCDGTSNGCQHPAGNSGTVCRAALGECDQAEACDGKATTCPPNDFKTQGTTCSADSLPCTEDVCDGKGACSHPPGFPGKVCRPSTGECDVEEKCDGAAAACPGNSFVTQGVACTDDGNVCTTDACNGSGACVHPAGNRGVECRAVNGVCDVADSCDGVTTTCPADAKKQAGASCADANKCNGSETCNNLGACVAGTALNCDDGIFCTIDSCVPASGCTKSNRPNGTTCTDGNACNGTSDTCTAGVCSGTGGVNCDDNNPCTADSCDSGGGCVHTLLAVGTPCNDGNACTQVDTCQTSGASRVCTGASPLSCDDKNPCTTDSCSPTSGCASVPVTNGTSCADATVCNGAETCQAGVCAPGTPLTCNDGNPCTTDTCNPTSGCATAPVTNGADCNDGNGCTQNDSCQAGRCQGTALNCNDNNPCTVDSCDAATGGCKRVDAQDGTNCADANPCNGTESCRAGACVAGPVPNCDDNNACTTDTCVASGPTAGCVSERVRDGAACSDNNTCTKNDTCQTGVCRAGEALDCNDNNECTADTCDTVKGCVNAARPEGATCDDKNPCSSESECRAGRCATKTGLDCDDDNPCTADSCDAVAQTCTHAAEPNGTVCSDSDACTTEDKCSSGLCVGGDTLDCRDTNACTREECAPATGCSPKPLNGMACSDGNPCTPFDECVGAVCTAGSDNPCKADNECMEDGSCNLLTGACTDRLKENGTPCSGGGQCRTGQCVGGDGGAGTGGTAGDAGTDATVGGSGGQGGSAGSAGSGDPDAGLEAGPTVEEVFKRHPEGCKCALPGDATPSRSGLWVFGLAVVALASRGRARCRRTAA
ncbi:MAG TPA: hypothetical protein VI072_26900 [Polyangiaceae bacterium]